VGGEPACGTEDVGGGPEARVVVDGGVVDDEAAIGGEEGGVGGEEDGLGVEGDAADGEDDGVDAEDFVLGVVGGVWVSSGAGGGKGWRSWGF